MRSHWAGLLLAGVQAVCLGWTSAHADTGFYVRGALGVNIAHSLGLRAGDNDRASRCDEFVNPQYWALEGCTATNRGSGAVDDWQSRFDNALGIIAGVAVGRRFGRHIRLEVEYFYRASDQDQTAPILAPSGAAYTEVFGAELPRAEERIWSVTGHHLFANAYLDFPNASRFTPYIGLGAGAGFTGMDYGALWSRHIDPATIETARGLPNEAEVRQNLAGTVSTTRDTLKDVLFGYQALAGLDYALTPALSLGILARWTDFDRFHDGGSYRRLRSHASNLRLDGSEPVAYQVQTDDLGFFAVSLNLTFRL